MCPSQSFYGTHAIRCWFGKNIENLYVPPIFRLYNRSRHPCIPPTTPVLYNELCQWIIIGLIHLKSQEKAVKSNLEKFLRKCKFNFFNAEIWPIFASFEPSFCSSSIFLTFWIELRFPKDSQILVDDFRHQNFWIWTFLGEVMAILVKNVCKIIELHCLCKNYLIFSLKWP